jgi:hypothetical protein
VREAQKQNGLGGRRSEDSAQVPFLVCHLEAAWTHLSQPFQVI